MNTPVTLVDLGGAIALLIWGGFGLRLGNHVIEANRAALALAEVSSLVCVLFPDVVEIFDAEFHRVASVPAPGVVGLVGTKTMLIGLRAHRGSEAAGLEAIDVSHPARPRQTAFHPISGIMSIHAGSGLRRNDSVLVERPGSWTEFDVDTGGSLSVAAGYPERPWFVGGLRVAGLLVLPAHDRGGVSICRMRARGSFAPGMQVAR